MGSCFANGERGPSTLPLDAKNAERVQPDDGDIGGADVALLLGFRPCRASDGGRGAHDHARPTQQTIGTGRFHDIADGGESSNVDGLFRDYGELEKCGKFI